MYLIYYVIICDYIYVHVVLNAVSSLIVDVSTLEPCRVY